MFIFKYLFLNLLVFNYAIFAQAADISSLTSGHFDAKQKSERIQITKDILKYIQNLDSAIPNIKPFDENWLLKELKETEIHNEMKKLSNYEIKSKEKRAKELESSLLYRQYMLKRLLKLIQINLKCITDISNNIQDEMTCWLELSIWLRYNLVINDSVFALTQEKILSKNDLENAYLSPAPSGMEFSTIVGYAAFYDFWSIGIQNKIILEYLKGNIK